MDAAAAQQVADAIQVLAMAVAAFPPPPAPPAPTAPAADPLTSPYEGGPDRISSTTPGAEPPRDAKDSGSARSHSTHQETSSSDRP